MENTLQMNHDGVRCFFRRTKLSLPYFVRAEREARGRVIMRGERASGLMRGKGSQSH